MMRSLNPIAVAAVISAGMKVLVLAGVDLSTELQVAILTFVDALLALYVQSQVATPRKLDDAGTSRKKVHEVACIHGMSLVPRWDAHEFRPMYPEQERRRD